MKYNLDSSIKPVSNNALDIIRVIAMTGIVADHYFQASGIPILANTGLHLGGGIFDGILCPLCLLVRNEMGERKL